MSLLDAARRLADVEPLELDNCVYCGSSTGHAPDCPWPWLPKIVAALAAAERLVERFRPTQYAIPARIICQVCHSEGPDWSHTATCAWAAAKGALEA